MQYTMLPTFLVMPLEALGGGLDKGGGVDVLV